MKQLPSEVHDTTIPKNTTPLERVRTDSFRVNRFTETTNPAMVDVARRIHAAGYKDMLFVNDDALTPEGFLYDDIDKAVGPEVNYFIAEQPTDEATKATLRKINIPAGGNLTDLPAFNLTLDTMWQNGLEELAAIEDPATHVKEIAALARTPESDPMVIFELLRNVLHESLGNDETWFFSIVSSTYQSLVDNFGDKAIRQIGEPVAFDDPRISKEITLVPALVHADTFISTLCQTAMQETDPKKQRKLIRSFVFFCDGLRNDEIDDDMRSVLDLVSQLQEKKELKL